MILDDIKNQLETIEPKVYYGMADEEEVIRATVWDYIVFNRASLKVSTNRTSYSDYYDVHIVRENFVPEGTDIEVINKMLEISGMRLADEGCTYRYTPKPNTNIVMEILTLHFVRARK